jgi:hypothetical protein
MAAVRPAEAVVYIVAVDPSFHNYLWRTNAKQIEDLHRTNFAAVDNARAPC